MRSLPFPLVKLPKVLSKESRKDSYARRLVFNSPSGGLLSRLLASGDRDEDVQHADLYQPLCRHL